MASNLFFSSRNKYALCLRFLTSSKNYQKDIYEVLLILVTLFLFVFLEACIEHFLASYVPQTFATPNWPLSYPPNQDCYWIVGGVSGKTFEITLGRGKTESNYDFVEVSIILLLSIFIDNACKS